MFLVPLAGIGALYYAWRRTRWVSEQPAGSPWLKELYEYFAPVREEIIARGISEEEVNADIDAAIAEVHAKRG